MNETANAGATPIPAIQTACVPYVAPFTTNGELNDRILRQFLQTLVVGVTGMAPTLVFPRWQENPPDQPDFHTDWAAIGEIDRTHDTFAAVVHQSESLGPSFQDPEWLIGATNGINTAFQFPSQAGLNYLISVGGLVLSPGIDYKVSGPNIFFAQAPSEEPIVYPEMWCPADVIYRNQILQIMCSFYGPNCQSNGELFSMGLSLAQNRETMRRNWFGLVEVSDARNVPALIKGRWVPGSDVELWLRRKQIYGYTVPNLNQAQGTIVTDSGLAENFIANAETE